MGELSQLRGALFDLTEQIRGLRDDLRRPQTDLSRELDRIHLLVDALSTVPSTIGLKIEESSAEILESHVSAIADYMG